jgi:hypothetical protein
MAFDTSFYGQIKPLEIANPLAQYAQLAQVQQAQNQNRLADLVFSEKQREVSENSALNDAYKGAFGPDGKLDRAKFISSAIERNLGSKLPALQKTWAEQDKGEAELNKARLEAQVRAAAQHRDALNGVNTYEDAVNWVKAGYSDPILKDVFGRSGRSIMQAASAIPQDPQGFLNWKRQNALGAEKYIEMTLPKIEFQDNGGQKLPIQMNPALPGYGAPAAGVAPILKEQSPDSKASNAVAIRGQNMTDARQREANSIAQGQKQQAGVVELRKEFNALPEVKNYKEVLPIIQSVKRAPDTPAGDIDLIYGVGKIMDPNSVVREGEMNLVIKSGSPAQRLMGYVNYVKGGGRLTEAQRNELMQVMDSRVSGLQSNYDAARTTYETAASRQGLPKEQIFIDNAAPQPAPLKPKPGKPAVLPKGWSVKEG